MELRVPIRFYGGPHDQKTAMTALLLADFWFYDGYALQSHCYFRVDELEYGYSKHQSLVYPRTHEGRERFLEQALTQPQYKISWD